MPIRNRDGSVYRVLGPNPHMITQTRWRDVVGVYGLTGDTCVIVQRETPALPKDVAPVVETAPPQSVVLEAWVLPATVVHVTDSLYGETTSSVRYGDKEKAMLRLESRGALSLVAESAKEYTPRSVVYLPKTRDWWMVAGVEATEGGHLLSCVPSSFQPGFG